MGAVAAASVRVRFLLDENSSRALLRVIRQQDAAIDIVRVGDPDAPSLGTLDPAILLFCEVEQRAQLTHNRLSMPAHITGHFAEGRHH